MGVYARVYGVYKCARYAAYTYVYRHEGSYSDLYKLIYLCSYACMVCTFCAFVLSCGKPCAPHGALHGNSSSALVQIHACHILEGDCSYDGCVKIHCTPSYFFHRVHQQQLGLGLAASASACGAGCLCPRYTRMPPRGLLRRSATRRLLRSLTSPFRRVRGILCIVLL